MVQQHYLICTLSQLFKIINTCPFSSDSPIYKLWFYIAEFHPSYDLTTGYPYFHSEEPDIEEEGTYTENCNGERSQMATWSHPLSEVINSLIKAGIRIDHLNEFPFSPYNCFNGLEEKEKGRFYTNSKHQTPLVYTILGTKI